MYVALGIGTMLLGGWVLVSPPTDDQAQVAPAPSASAVAPAFAAPPTSSQSPPTVMPEPRQPLTQQRVKDVIPLTPTEPGQPGEPGVPGLASPTRPMMGEGVAGVAPLGGLPGGGGRPMPMAPTYRRPSSPQFGALPAMSAFDQQRVQLSAASVPQKAFANYQPPASGVSPYMNLFRNDTSGGTVDNYTTLVRPALQQQNANQEFGNDIYGLQRNARIQSAALQHIDYNARSLQGVGTPQYYMNSAGGNPNSGGVNSYYPNNYGP